MTSIAQINENEQMEIRGSLKKFFAEYHLSGLLKMCRAEKQKDSARMLFIGFFLQPEQTGSA